MQKKLDDTEKYKQKEIKTPHLSPNTATLFYINKSFWYVFSGQ